MKNLILGVDVGGTVIKLGLIDSSNRIISRSYLETKTFARNKNKMIESLIVQILSLIKEKAVGTKAVLGIGLGLPGAVDSQEGVVRYLTNVFGWKNVPLKKIVEKSTGIKTFIDNDVNLFTLGEWKYGAGRGFKDVVCLTLGTGVGGGLILNNQIYRGASSDAGELGHIPINERGPSCNCGGFACLECYLGSRYLLKKAKRIFGKKITLESVTRMAKNKNSKAIRFWRDTGEHLGNGLVGVVNLINPECIVIGGGISRAFRFLALQARRQIRHRAMKSPGRLVKIVRAQLADDAGLFGANVLVKNCLTSKA